MFFFRKAISFFATFFPPIYTYYLIKNRRFQNKPSNIEWDLTNGPRSVSWDRAIRYSGFFGVRSVGPVGDFLETNLPSLVFLGPSTHSTTPQRWGWVLSSLDISGEGWKIFIPWPWFWKVPLAAEKKMGKEPKTAYPKTGGFRIDRFFQNEYRLILFLFIYIYIRTSVLNKLHIIYVSICIYTGRFGVSPTQGCCLFKVKIKV